MIDIANEKVIALADASRHLPKRRGGKKVNLATLYRWCQRGVRGVRLEHIQVGGTKCTSLEGLQRFFERLSALNDGSLATPQVRTSKQRQRAVEKANAELAKEGW